MTCQELQKYQERFVFVPKNNQKIYLLFSNIVFLYFCLSAEHDPYIPTSKNLNSTDCCHSRVTLEICLELSPEYCRRLVVCHQSTHLSSVHI